MYIFSLSFFTDKTPDDMKTIEIAFPGDNNCKTSIEDEKHVKLQTEGGALAHAKRVHIFGCSHSILMFFWSGDVVIFTILFLENNRQLLSNPSPIRTSSMSSGDGTTSLLDASITGD
tara:strand:+ start:223 stop:573 length:351 start_codon:yes stop_codon:yes gene_type:complete